MCPACMTTLALIAAGSTSAGGLAVFGLRRLIAKKHIRRKHK